MKCDICKNDKESLHEISAKCDDGEFGFKLIFCDDCYYYLLGTPNIIFVAMSLAEVDYSCFKKQNKYSILMSEFKRKIKYYADKDDEADGEKRVLLALAYLFCKEQNKQED